MTARYRWKGGADGDGPGHGDGPGGGVELPFAFVSTKRRCCEDCAPPTHVAADTPRWAVRPFVTKVCGAIDRGPVPNAAAASYAGLRRGAATRCGDAR